MPHSIIKSKLLRYLCFSLFLCAVLAFITPTQTTKASALLDDYCQDRWETVGSTCGCIGSLCTNKIIQQKYRYCPGGSFPLDEYREVFQCFSWGGCGCN